MWSDIISVNNNMFRVLIIIHFKYLVILENCIGRSGCKIRSNTCLSFNTFVKIDSRILGARSWKEPTANVVWG